MSDGVLTSAHPIRIDARRRSRCPLPTNIRNQPLRRLLPAPPGHLLVVLRPPLSRPLQDGSGLAGGSVRFAPHVQSVFSHGFGPHMGDYAGDSTLGAKRQSESRSQMPV